ncbi:hypothetical protein [Streptomyces sp. NPDC019937]|uniref:hypothetical protein n=1 Tax=Streptomyces sp. NPDC019937 TaxID=3154787 RepID=UPI0033D3D999
MPNRASSVNVPFKPVAQDAGKAYQGDCRDAHVTVEAQGSGRGTKTLIDAGEGAKGGFPSYLAFSDGPDGDGNRKLKQSIWWRCPSSAWW